MGEIEGQDNDLVGNCDAMAWAARFVRRAKENPEIPTDIGTMVAWFATAIMAGYDQGRREGPETTDWHKFAQDYLDGNLPTVDQVLDDIVGDADVKVDTERIIAEHKPLLDRLARGGDCLACAAVLDGSGCEDHRDAEDDDGHIEPWYPPNG